VVEAHLEGAVMMKRTFGRSGSLASAVGDDARHEAETTISRETHVGASDEGQLNARLERRERRRLARAVFFPLLVKKDSAA
jgi:hypothetical protein